MNTQKIYYSCIVLAVGFFLPAPSAQAKPFYINDRSGNIFFYATQSLQFGLNNSDYYDTERDLNSALFNFLIEGDYSFTDELKLYCSGMVTVDWMYDLKHDDQSWNKKMFADSRSELYCDDEYWQVLKEVYLTWYPKDFFFRIGKQVVTWGELFGIRIMDRINPLDQRRGFADVEFASSLIPIWLVRAEYYFPRHPSWLSQVGVEFIFNPNADFIPDQVIRTGNDKGGIWAPDITFPNPLPWIPASTARIGSGGFDIDEPDDWSPDGYEYGIRFKGLLDGAYWTLNYFYGYDNEPVTVAPPPAPGPPPMFPIASDGSVLIPGDVAGYHRLFRFAGFTIAQEFDSLRSLYLGGAAPLFRLEALYAFDIAFGTANEADPAFVESFEKHDEIRWALAVDWQVKLNWLNRNNFFMLQPAFSHRKIRNYPHGYLLKEGAGMVVEDDNTSFSLMATTSYALNKINPSFFWLHLFETKSDMYRIQIQYDRSHEWHYAVGMVILNSSDAGGFNVFENKDYVFFKVSYRWG